MLAILAIGAILPGGRGLRQLEEGKNLVDELDKTRFIEWDFQPG